MADNQIMLPISNKELTRSLVVSQMAPVLDECERQHPWLLTEQLVVKPDQLIKRRGKLGLLGINLTWPAVK